MTAVIEVALSYILKAAKGRDAKTFVRGKAFAALEHPTISITSPDCGETNSTLTKDHTHDGSGRFPILEWSAPDGIAPHVREWLLVVEDPDAPLPKPVLHGLYAGITKTRVEPVDFEIHEKETAMLTGGFYYGKNYRSVVYIPPRPLIPEPHWASRYITSTKILEDGISIAPKHSVTIAKNRPLRNHGLHRYFFQVIALSESLDKAMLSSKPSREAVAEAIEGKVLGWGFWIGSCERRWK